MFRHNPENQPIQQVAVFNQGTAGDIDAGTSILATALTPKKPPSVFRIMVSLHTAAKFKAQITQGAVTKDLIFNADTNLVVDGLYIFDMLVASGDTINFEQDQANQVVNLLIVQEILVGGQ